MHVATSCCYISFLIIKIPRTLVCRDIIWKVKDDCFALLSFLGWWRKWWTPQTKLFIRIKESWWYNVTNTLFPSLPCSWRSWWIAQTKLLMQVWLPHSWTGWWSLQAKLFMVLRLPRSQIGLINYADEALYAGESNRPIYERIDKRPILHGGAALVVNYYACIRDS